MPVVTAGEPEEGVFNPSQLFYFFLFFLEVLVCLGQTLLKDSLRVNEEIVCYSAIEKTSGYLLQGSLSPRQLRSPIQFPEVLKGFHGFMLVSTTKV